MSASALIDEIATAVERPPQQRDFFDATAEELADARSEVASNLAQIRDWRARLAKITPDVLERKLARLEESLTLEAWEIGRQEKRLIDAAGVSADEERLTEQIKENVRREPQLIQSALAEIGRFRYLPQQYIRADAVEFYRREVDEAEGERKDILARLGNRDYERLGPRAKARLAELETVISEWTQTEKLCRLGEQIHALREEREKLVDQRDRLARERRARVLVVT